MYVPLLLNNISQIRGPPSIFNRNLSRGLREGSIGFTRCFLQGINVKFHQCGPRLSTHLLPPRKILDPPLYIARSSEGLSPSHPADMHHVGGVGNSKQPVKIAAEKSHFTRINLRKPKEVSELKIALKKI